MAFENTFDELFAQVDRVVRVAAITADGLAPSKEKTLLTAVVAKLKEARADAAVYAPASLDALRQIADKQRAVVEQLGAQVKTARRDLEAAAVATPPAARAAVPSPAPPLEPDLTLGGRLREELLRRYGPSVDESAKPHRGPGKDIWEDWA